GVASAAGTARKPASAIPGQQRRILTASSAAPTTNENDTTSASGRGINGRMAPSALASRKAAADDAEFTYRPRPSTESDSSEVTDRDSSRQAASPDAARPGTLTRALGLKIGRIVIDPGHGGHDTGTIGPHGLREKDLVLDVALRLRRLVEQKMGADAIMTRGDDTFIPLEERTAIANQKAA